MTVVHPAGQAGQPAPEVTAFRPAPCAECSGDDADDDPAPPRHLSLVVTTDGVTMSASRRESMARHPSAKRQG